MSKKDAKSKGANSAAKECKNSNPHHEDCSCQWGSYPSIFGFGRVDLYSKKPGVSRVNEKRRCYVGVHGKNYTLRNVTELDLRGNWIRTKSDEGFVVANPDNVLAIVIDGESLR